MKSLFNGTINELCEVIADLSANSDLVNFAGERTLGSIVDKMHNGCKNLTEQYNALPCELIKIASPSYQMDTEGLFFDVATFLNGTPECWVNENWNNDNKPVKDFYINATFSQSVSQKTIFEKLIQVVQIIDSLEGNGQRLNVFICCYAKGSKGKDSLLCKIKDSSEPVNIEQLIYLCASPAILRYCFIRLQYNAYRNGYTSTVDTDEDERMLQNSEIFYIPSIATDRKNGITDYNETNLQTAYKI